MKYLTKFVLKKIKGKTCLLRLPLNVTNSEIKTSLRIEQSIESLKKLSKNGCKIIAIGHRGRPDVSKINSADVEYKKKFSLKKISNYISKQIKQKIVFIDEFNVDKIKDKLKEMKNGEIIMLENVRFLKEERLDSISLAKKYSSLADVYINDAFSVAHRKETSISAVAKIMPAYIGDHFKNEIRSLEKVIKSTKHPFVLIVGGAKVGIKGDVVNRFIKKADNILVGGMLATTYFVSKGMPVGKSLYDKNSIEEVKLWSVNKKIILPKDVTIYDKSILDIGENTINEFSEIIKNAKMIVWNGPMGEIEIKRFSTGTRLIAEAISKSKAYSVIGGGETVSFVRKNNLDKNISFISIGGGAMLEFLAGKEMYGINALKYTQKIKI